MSRKVEIEIEIKKNGSVHFHVKGRKGPSCLEFIDIMRSKLGKVDHYELTNEYYEKEETEMTSKLEIENPS